ncbi:ABC transporter permease [Kocuria tytonicola]|uniref:Energy-coupling factor transporter transmembrane protein EcfT n=1 Tax=Kocuria tytonicola TaxID=2055946 RepID=A0A3L9L9U4_9MICC|nr:energy-coupling factor transporter transmembrane protein EcfT [Kocuria tytonicola]RLY94924.1 energy-coupling factor transporter transmembrane protein EcfT [Kocuria tytonicola]RLZ03885.1 ABC transporter permease [Kocuria tytonicola]
MSGSPDVRASRTGTATAHGSRPRRPRPHCPRPRRHRPRRSTGRRDDLLGTYVPGHSVLHRCPLWLKALLLLGLGAAVMVLRAWPVSLGILVLTAVLSAGCGFGLRRWAVSLRPLWFLVLLLSGYHLLTAGPARAADVVLSLLAVVALSRLLLTTTELPRLVDGLVVVCSPVRLLGADPERIGLAVSLMIRSVPWLFGVLSTLRDAAAARTVSPRATQLVTPAVIATVDYAHRTGEALAARGLE